MDEVFHFVHFIYKGGDEMVRCNLDRMDLKILDILQNNSKTSIDSLCEKVFLSSASVQRRLKKLRESNVIANEVIVVNPLTVGQTMTFIVSVELVIESSFLLKQFKNKMLNEARIQQCYYVTGEGDFILIVTAKNMTEFDELADELFRNDANVKRYKTSVAMERTKVSLTIPLELATGS